jgi:hypothetical protein
MALLRAHQDDPVAPAATPAKLTPKGVISVTGKPSFANLLTFQRDAIKGTTFKFTVADATIRNLKAVRGYVVSGKRTDGWLTTEVAHDFGTNDTKLKASTRQAHDGRVYTADFTQFASKGPAGGVLDVGVEVNKGLKLAGGYNLGNQLASLNVTKKVIDEEGVLTYTAAVNSRQAVKLGVTRKRGDTTLAATYIFPVLVGGEYKHKDFKVVATAPVTQEGVGDAKIVASYEKTFLI